MMPFLRYSLGFWLLLGVVLDVQAQYGRVQGVVYNETGEPLPGTHVYIEGTSQGSVTDADGRFLLERVPAGEQVVVVRRVGYETLRERVRLAAGVTETVRFVLKEQPIDLDAVVVRRTTLSEGRVTLLGLPGAVQLLTLRELDRFRFNDIGRVLQSVPGVNVQEEDGYGLRPNIGLRGSGSERSSKITVMEDGVLMAPAPYAAPAAYYFPTVGRMHAIEVRKGSGQIKYGPYTTGGALNLISTPIPLRFSGKLDLLAGERQERTLHAHVGNASTHWGFVVETYQSRTDGFKKLDGGGPTGFEIQDYLAKLRLQTRSEARLYQALTFKVVQRLETSHETYLGVTEDDFARTPFRRYAGSQKDVMKSEHKHYMLRHVMRPLRNVDVVTTLYRTDFHRNWYKLDRVRASNSTSWVRIADLLANPQTYAAEYALVTGQTSSIDKALEVKANNRTYYAQGVETSIGWSYEGPALSHALEVGVRVHKDQLDRFQWSDYYRMDQGVMKLTEAGTPGTESNRIEQAHAVAGYAQYRLEVGRWTVVPGLRYEHIVLKRRDYGKNDPQRTGVALQTQRNTVEVWIPGIGIDYALHSGWHIFAGVHKGFAPPGATPGARPEESLNYELGMRYRGQGLGLDGVLFFHDYRNLLGADLTAVGGTGSGDLFNGGAVQAYGLELAAYYDLGRLGSWVRSVPLSISYTLSRATFEHAFESQFEPWGRVAKGDELPYLPHHQLATSLDLIGAKAEMHFTGRYVSKMRTKAGQGAFLPSQSTDPALVLDVAADYRLAPQVKLFASVRNLTNAVYIASRRPAGLRPGLPRQLLLGIKAEF
jgi:Fe(3+) dicitrate transport protein